MLLRQAAVLCEQKVAVEMRIDVDVCKETIDWEWRFHDHLMRRTLFGLELGHIIWFYKFRWAVILACQCFLACSNCKIRYFYQLQQGFLSVFTTESARPP